MTGLVGRVERESNVKPSTIEPNGEARVDWRVKVLDEGEAVIRMKALTDEESDAMEQKFPCYIHGMLKMESYSGAIRPKDESGKFTIDVPEDRRPKQSRLEVRYSPTLAGAMVDALPYLVDYPYGCTEQTLNRFLPTVITQKILLDMKLDLKDIQKKRTNLNAQEIGDDAERAKQWEQTASPATSRNPVFDEDEVRQMVKDGVERLTEMQCSDGGWGWFSGWGEHSDAAHHGRGGPRPANRQAERRGPGARHVGTRRRVAQTLPGRAGPTDQERRDQGQAGRLAVEGLCRQPRRLRLHGAGRRRREERRHARVPLPRPHPPGRLRHGHVRHRVGEAGREGKARHDPAEHRPVRPAGRREPDGLAPPARGLLVVLVRQRVRGPGLLPEAAGADRSQGRAGPAAGQVSVEQPQERHLLELDPRHGPVHRGDGRLHPRAAARTGRR